MRRETNPDRWYRALELDPWASLDNIAQAHRDLATVWHPDRFSNDLRLRRLAEQKLYEINAAYEGLRRLKAARAPEPAAPPQPSAEPGPRPAPTRPPRMPRLFHFSALIAICGGGVAVLLVVAGGAAAYRAMITPVSELEGLLESVPGHRAALHAAGGPVDLPRSLTNGLAVISRRVYEAAVPAQRTAAGDQAGMLRISNRSRSDAFATVISQSGAPVRSRPFEVPAGAELLLHGMGPGTYYVSFAFDPESATPGTRKIVGPFEYPSHAAAGPPDYEIVLSTRK